MEQQQRALSFVSEDADAGIFCEHSYECETSFLQGREKVTFLQKRRRSSQYKKTISSSEGSRD
jgi:hypothetical protein